MLLALGFKVGRVAGVAGKVDRPLGGLDYKGAPQGFHLVKGTAPRAVMAFYKVHGGGAHLGVLAPVEL